MKFTLNPEFYKIEAIIESLKDFSEVCDGKIIDENGIEIELVPKEDVENLKEEFCNYVIGTMKNKSLV